MPTVFFTDIIDLTVCDVWMNQTMMNLDKKYKLLDFDSTMLKSVKYI